MSQSKRPKSRIDTPFRPKTQSNKHSKSRTQTKHIIESDKSPMQETFMFLYKDSEGKLYTSMDKITPVDGTKITIYPVVFTGCNPNVFREDVTYNSKERKYVATLPDQSWLQVIYSKDQNMVILPFEGENIVIYNNIFFHCVDDLIDYLKYNGPEYLPVN